MPRKSEKKNEVNLFELIPVRNREFFKKEDGHIVIVHPKFNNKPFTYLLKFMKKPNFKIELDKYGSFIWENCDGEKSVGEIVQLLRENFGEEVEPVSQRASLFFVELFRSGFIKYKK